VYKMKSPHGFRFKNPLSGVDSGNSLFVESVPKPLKG
jgi:hypothetical protein